jgi:hypothetical protein
MVCGGKLVIWLEKFKLGPYIYYREKRKCLPVVSLIRQSALEK